MSDNAIFVAASGALVQEMRLEVLSNNLANIKTAGFKEDTSVFSSYISCDTDRMISADSVSSATGTPAYVSPYNPVSVQVEFDGTKTNFTQGPIRQTGNPLDFAIEGNGFFCIKTSDGIEQYTRKGNFTINRDHVLVTQDGMRVLDANGGKIKISGGDVMVDEEGDISVDGVVVGKLKIVDFERPYALMKTGDTAFIAADPGATTKDAQGYTLKQGCIELSNVDPIRVMTEMIEVHRAFESYQKVIRSMDEVEARSINEIGRVE